MLLHFSITTYTQLCNNRACVTHSSLRSLSHHTTKLHTPEMQTTASTSSMFTRRSSTLEAPPSVPSASPIQRPFYSDQNALSSSVPMTSLCNAAATSLGRTSTSSGCGSLSSSSAASSSSTPAPTPPHVQLQCHHKRTIGSDSDSDDDDGCLARQSPRRPLSSPTPLDNHRQQPFATSDELPVFRCQSLSPSSRSISPIDRHQHIDDDDDNDDKLLFNFSMSPCGSVYDDHCSLSMEEENDRAYDGNSSPQLADRISLEELHARLSGGGDRSASSSVCHTPVGKRLKLETIVEGVFLETPPPAQRGDWCVATQSIGRFVEDQRQRRFAAMLDDGNDDGGSGVSSMAMEMIDDEEAGTQCAVDLTTAAVHDRQQQQQQVDRMLSISFQTKLNMC